MKCYILQATAYAGQYNRIIMSNVLKVFANRELGEKYICETWPEAQLRCDDTWGRHWVMGPDEDFTWTARYQLIEQEIEGL